MKRTTVSLCLVALAAAAVTTTTATTAGADPGEHDRAASTSAVAEVRKAIRPFEDVVAAKRAGYAAPPPGGHACVPGMGYHYVKASLFGSEDPSAPPILLYGSDGKGGLRLLGAEFLTTVEQTGTHRPDLAGEPFEGPMSGHGPGPHYDLHVWTHLTNPDGVFATENPRVSCP